MTHVDIRVTLHVVYRVLKAWLLGRPLRITIVDRIEA